MTVGPKPGDPGSTKRRDLSALRMDHDEVGRRPRRRLWLWGLLVFLGALLVLAGLRLPVPWLVPGVEATTVQVLTSTQAATVLNATGYTYARNRAAVGAKIIGRVIDLKVDEGDRVEAGDVIAVLDSADLEAAVREGEAAVVEARATLADARRESLRRTRLHEAGVVSEAERDTATTRLEVTRARLGRAEAQLASLQAQLAYTTLRAPISGVVIERNVEVGEMVAPGGFTSQQSTGSIVRLADPASLEVEADINESYIARLELGQPAAIRVDAVPDHEYHGRLRQIVPTADRQRAVVEVKVSIDDRDPRLVPDMSCSVTFLATEGMGELGELPSKSRLFVARSAVVTAGGGHYLWRIEEDRVHKVPVELGEEQEHQVEVLAGVAGGEVVARRPQDGWRDGQRVRIRDGS